MKVLLLKVLSSIFLKKKTGFFIDLHFKNIIESHIDFQRSIYPQQQFISNTSVGSISTLRVTKDTGSKKPRNKERTTSNSSLPPNFMKLEGRHRFSNISKLPQLRILKRDIRRRYLEMYYNVSNSHDINLFSRFLHDFCTPNCQSVVFFPSTKGPIVRNGIQEILQDTFTKQSMLPDGVVRYAETKIYVPLETPGSRIVASVSFRGTKLFDILPASSSSSISKSTSNTTASSKNEVLSKTESHGLSEDSTEQSSSISSVHPILHSFKTARLSPTLVPVVLDVNAVFTLHLDVSNRIERFVADSLSVSRHNVPLNDCF